MDYDCDICEKKFVDCKCPLCWDCKSMDGCDCPKCKVCDTKYDSFGYCYCVYDAACDECGSIKDCIHNYN